jgi:hypothetical protein
MAPELRMLRSCFAAPSKGPTSSCEKQEPDELLVLIELEIKTEPKSVRI